jgi:hypothetical protein
LASVDRFRTELVHTANMPTHQIEIEMAKSFSVFTPTRRSGSYAPGYAMQVTGKQPATSVGGPSRPNERIAAGPLIRFLQAAGKPLNIDYSEDTVLASTKKCLAPLQRKNVWRRFRKRPAPSKQHGKLTQVAKSARRLLKSLGINDPDQAPDGPRLRTELRDSGPA